MAEVGDHRVKILGHFGHLGCRQVGDPQAGDQVVHPAGGHAFEVAGGNDGGQYPLGAAAAFQQSVGKERTGAELGNDDIDDVDTGIEVAVTVTVASVGARLGDGGLVHAEDLVGLGGQDLVDEALQHLTHQVRVSLGQQFVEIGRRVDMMRTRGHRGVPFDDM